MPQSAQQTSAEPRSKQTNDLPVKMSSNWLHDEFPTLSAGKFRLTFILQAKLLKTNDNVVS